MKPTNVQELLNYLLKLQQTNDLSTIEIRYNDIAEEDILYSAYFDLTTRFNLKNNCNELVLMIEPE